MEHQAVKHYSTISVLAVIFCLAGVLKLPRAIRNHNTLLLYGCISLISLGILLLLFCWIRSRISESKE
ncbi:MAG: hypothetical protein N2484_00540 [Clostridia bacterium]|nr:hypothetical protein [Clostridia bacterium]